MATANYRDGGVPNWVVDQRTGDVLGLRLADGSIRPMARHADLIPYGTDINAGASYSAGILGGDGGLYAVSETTPYVTLTASGLAFTGPCDLAGWYCSVAAGNITIYDALSATGTPIVPATALAVGPLPIFGAGTNGKLALTTGCYVVLSGAATVRVAVG